MAKATRQQRAYSTKKGIDKNLVPNYHSVLLAGSGIPRALNATRVGCVMAVVASAFNVGLRDIGAHTRSRAHIALARQVAMYLSHIVLGLNFTEIGMLFERDRTTAAYASRLVEDRRDDAQFDLVLDHLEAAISKLQTWASAFEARIQ